MKAIIRLGALSTMIDIKEIRPDYQIPLPVRLNTSIMRDCTEKDVMYMNDATGKRMVFDYNRTLDVDGEQVALYVFKEIV